MPNVVPEGCHFVECRGAILCKVNAVSYLIESTEKSVMI